MENNFKNDDDTKRIKYNAKLLCFFWYKIYCANFISAETLKNNFIVDV